MPLSVTIHSYAMNLEYVFYECVPLDVQKIIVHDPRASNGDLYTGGYMLKAQCSIDGNTLLHEDDDFRNALATAFDNGYVPSGFNLNYGNVGTLDAFLIYSMGDSYITRYVFPKFRLNSPEVKETIIIKSGNIIDITP